MLRRLYTLVFDLLGRVRDERFSDAEGFLIRSRPFVQRRRRAGRWAGSRRGLPPHDQVTRPRLSSGKAWDPASPVIGVRSHNPTFRVIVTPAPAFLHQAAAGQQISGGAVGGEVQRGIARPEPRQEFARAPARMLPPDRADHAGDVLGDPVWAPMRRTAPILAPRVLEAREPFAAVLRLIPYRAQSSTIAYRSSR